MDKASSRGSGKADEERGCEWGGGENQNCTPQLPQEEPCPSSAPVGPQLTWGTLPTQASCPEDQSSGARTCSPPAEPRKREWPLGTKDNTPVRTAPGSGLARAAGHE